MLFTYILVTVTTLAGYSVGYLSCFLYNKERNKPKERIKEKG